MADNNPLSSGSEGLSPCPFCGSRCVTLTTNEAHWPIVECDDCGSRGACTNLRSNEAVRLWNTRASLQPATPTEGEEAAAEMRQTATELRANSNGDCNAIAQALMWERKADALATPTAMAQSSVCACLQPGGDPLGNCEQCDPPQRSSADSIHVRGGDYDFDLLTDLVTRFSAALLEKLKAAEVKYGHNSGWARDDWKADCQRHLNEHLAKGDPRDVAAYCAFLWHHGWPTVGPMTPREYELVNELRAPAQPSSDAWQAAIDLTEKSVLSEYHSGRLNGDLRIKEGFKNLRAALTPSMTSTDR